MLATDEGNCEEISIAAQPSQSQFSAFWITNVVELTFSLGAREKQLGREVLDASNIRGPQKRAGNEGSFREKGVFLEYFLGKQKQCFIKMCGTCKNNFQEVKLWSEKGRQKRTSRICYPVLCILWVLSSLNSQTSSSYLMKKIIQQFCRWLLVRALLHNQRQNMLSWVVELTSNMHDCISSNT